jgi:hypothetical protein
MSSELDRIQNGIYQITLDYTPFMGDTAPDTEGVSPSHIKKISSHVPRRYITLLRLVHLEIGYLPEAEELLKNMGKRPAKIAELVMFSRAYPRVGLNFRIFAMGTNLSPYPGSILFPYLKEERSGCDIGEHRVYEECPKNSLFLLTEQEKALTEINKHPWFGFSEWDE